MVTHHLTFRLDNVNVGLVILDYREAVIVAHL